MDAPNDLMRRKERGKVFGNIDFDFGSKVSREARREKREKVFRNFREEKSIERCSDWSKLCPDVLRKIFETLSPIDSHRAKTVCSDWYSVWKTCDNRPPCPLRIIHQGGLVDPEEDKKTRTRKLVEQDKSYCMASSGSWLLMVDSRFGFHLLNVLTRKKIDLPSMNSPPIPGGDDNWWTYGSVFGPSCWKTSAVLWINEVTGYYVVAWIFEQHNLFSYRKGDDSWSNVRPRGSDSGFLDVAYMNSKLYVLTTDQHIKIFDVSKGCMLETEIKREVCTKQKDDLTQL